MLCVSIALPAQQSMAQSAPPVDILPAKAVKDKSLLPQAGAETHPPLKLTPDKSEILRLEKQAGSIIIGNPDNLSILADSAKTLVLVPKLPGATYVTILDTAGTVIMQRHIIVASPKERYIRIRKSCAGSGGDCQPTQVYFCPDSCHEVRVQQEISEANDSPFDALEELAEQAQAENDSEASEE